MADEGQKRKFENHGGAYIKTGKGPKKTVYLSVGVIKADLDQAQTVTGRDGKERIYISLFKNTNKKQDSHPDYNVLVQKPRNGGEQAQAAAPKPKTDDGEMPF